MNLLSLCWSGWFGPIKCFPYIVLASHKLNYKAMLEKKMWLKQKLALLCAWKFQQPLLISRMYMTIKILWLYLILASILLTGRKIPPNKGGCCLFRKSQLDSRTFGMAGPTGLWTHYHLGGDLNRLTSTKKRVPVGFILP